LENSVQTKPKVFLYHLFYRNYINKIIKRIIKKLGIATLNAKYA
jgi:hypothetical protein